MTTATQHVSADAKALLILKSALEVGAVATYTPGAQNHQDVKNRTSIEIQFPPKSYCLSSHATVRTAMQFLIPGDDAVGKDAEDALLRITCNNMKVQAVQIPSGYWFAALDAAHSELAESIPDHVRWLEQWMDKLMGELYPGQEEKKADCEQATVAQRLSHCMQDAARALSSSASCADELIKERSRDLAATAEYSKALGSMRSALLLQERLSNLRDRFASTCIEFAATVEGKSTK